MALSADVEYKTMGKTERLHMLGGDAATFYKGAILNIDANGYMEIPTDAGSVIPFGVCVKQVIEDATHKDVEVERGIIAVPKRTIEEFVFEIVAGGASNTDLNSKYIDIYNGIDGYRVWFDVNSTGSAQSADGLTLTEVDVGTGDNVTTVAAAWVAIVDALAAFGATNASGVITVICVKRGHSIAPVKQATLVDGIATLVETYAGRALQADIGVLFYAITDDGVVYASGKSTTDIEAGLCLGFIDVCSSVPTEGVDLLFIDFKQKTLGD